MFQAIAFGQCGRAMAKSGLNGIGNIDEFMGEAKTRGNMLTQRAHAIALGRMMSGGQVRNTRLAREMHGLFGNLTR